MAAVVKAAIRLSRLQRQRFSSYRKAMAAARLALAQLPLVKPEALQELEALGKQLGGQLAAATDKKQKKSLARKRKLALRRHKQLRGAALKRLDVLLEISRIHGARGDYRKAVVQAEQVMTEAGARGLSSKGALLEVVNNLFYLGAYGSSLARAAEGLALARKLPPARRKLSRLRQIQFHNAMGSVYAVQGRTREAVAALSEAMKLARSLNNPAEVAASHNNLGNAYRRAGRYDKAREHFSKALAMDVTRKDRLGMAFDHANLGLAEEHRGRGAAARGHFKKAVTLSRDIGAPLNELKALAGLGRLGLTGAPRRRRWPKPTRGWPSPPGWGCATGAGASTCWPPGHSAPWAKRPPRGDSCARASRSWRGARRGCPGGRARSRWRSCRRTCTTSSSTCWPSRVRQSRPST